MFEAQNNQLQSYLPTSSGHKLIKFCYFMLPLLLFSCGDSEAKKTTESQQTEAQVENSKAPENASKTILCFGDSITAGYGLEDTTDAYPALVQQKIDSLDLNYTVINSGVSGETTAGGKSRIDWVIKQPIDIFLLELGANDGLRGVPLSETRANLQAIIDVVKAKSPETTIILAGMELPPNMGKAYTTEFRELYADLAQKNNLEFIPFILKDVGGIASLNQGDGIHPNVEGHKLLAETVWETLGPLVR
ncbi:arylesterase [Gelidibacter salicanalis]|uniref:Arylesterase n=1 Tax=Gelidibacter salicanalis TaxID=291193 RepID=A0A934KYK8_9FLAO|nr:arylesterase [Gelidibacter salicanalis]MBJ7882818.1 arylesterase [Gelidibacter salicanalis]